MTILPLQGQSFSNTKVPFTRIPDVDEYMEEDIPLLHTAQ